MKNYSAVRLDKLLAILLCIPALVLFYSTVYDAGHAAGVRSVIKPAPQKCLTAAEIRRITYKFVRSGT